MSNDNNETKELSHVLKYKKLPGDLFIKKEPRATRPRHYSKFLEEIRRQKKATATATLLRLANSIL